MAKRATEAVEGAIPAEELRGSFAPMPGLPIQPPFAPMEARSVEKIPEGRHFLYEPKWDGFRCLAFRDGEHVELQSKAGQPLARYFPELVALLRSLKPARFVLDGEIVVPLDGQLSFDELLLRIHPAESRVRKLAAEHPAELIVFDVLVDENGRSLVGLPLEARRRQLEKFAARYFGAAPSRHSPLTTHNSAAQIVLSPATRDAATAKKWLGTLAGLDGVIAKRLDMAYQTGERGGMEKIKKLRTADCVVGGFRYGAKERLVGSLLLGLYDEDGKLNHIGFTSTISRADKPALTKKLEELTESPGFTGRAPGGPSRWSTERSGEWEPLKPVLVAEVQYDHFSGNRFRHGTRFLRWRPEKNPRQCTMDQVKIPARSSTRLLLAG